ATRLCGNPCPFNSSAAARVLLRCRATRSLATSTADLASATGATLFGAPTLRVGQLPLGGLDTRSGVSLPRGRAPAGALRPGGTSSCPNSLALLNPERPRSPPPTTAPARLPYREWISPGVNGRSVDASFPVASSLMVLPS